MPSDYTAKVAKKAVDGEVGASDLPTGTHDEVGAYVEPTPDSRFMTTTLPDFKQAILLGLGSNRRVYSSSKIKDNAHVVAITIMDPRMKSFSWKAAQPTAAAHSSSHGTIPATGSSAPAQTVQKQAHDIIVTAALSIMRRKSEAAGRQPTFPEPSGGADDSSFDDFEDPSVMQYISTKGKQVAPASSGSATGSATLACMPGSAGASSTGSAVPSVPHSEAMAREAEKEAVSDQLSAYLRSSVSITNLNPLQWWRDVGTCLYPHLAPIARRFLSVLATSAAVERVFSRTKFWARDERGRIGDAALERCTSLGAYLSAPWARIQAPSALSVGPKRGSGNVERAFQYLEHPGTAASGRKKARSNPSA